MQRKRDVSAAGSGNSARDPYSGHYGLRGAIPPDQYAAPRRSCAAIMGRGSARESRREINWLANELGVGERLEAIDLAHVDLAEASNPLNSRWLIGTAARSAALAYNPMSVKSAFL